MAAFDCMQLKNKENAPTKTGKKKKATKKTATREPARRQEATADIDVLLLSDEE